MGFPYTKRELDGWYESALMRHFGGDFARGQRGGSMKAGPNFARGQAAPVRYIIAPGSIESLVWLYVHYHGLPEGCEIDR
jgi:hypothetical protein